VDSVTGTFALKNFRPQKSHMWNLHSRERKGHGTFAPGMKSFVPIRSENEKL